MKKKSNLKIFLFFVYIFDLWEGVDSNHRTPKRGDLQSPAIATMRPSQINI